MQSSLFSIDNGPQFVGWHNPKHRWNGWAVPSFDPYASRQVVEWANSTGCEFTWAGDVLTYIEDGETFTVPRDACGRYIIGDGWVWDAAPDWILEPVLNAADAKACIRAMNESGMLFHLDDSPETVGLFTATECTYVRQRVAELFRHLPCPHAECLRVTNA